MKAWYLIDNVNTIDSPSIVLYEENLMFNLSKMLAMVEGNASRLMPHIKTNKMPKVVQRMIALGITNFKASTIAEAEIAAREGAHKVLVAHQLVGPKVQRFINLCKNFPNTQISTIIDNIDSANDLNDLAIEAQIEIGVYIDINSGMNRTGIVLGNALEELVEIFSSLKGIRLQGLHVYDGHLRNSNYTERAAQIETEFEPINSFYQRLKLKYADIDLICGGTPSFTNHLNFESRITSPGTCVLWDWGYGDNLEEQNFKPAALVLCRVISKPAPNIVTTDLGHKAVGSENSIDKRIKFLNLENYELVSQSEEHGVLKVKNWERINVGDVFYGIPYHICPTINLYDEVSLIKNHKKVAVWEVTARRRKLTY